MINKKTTHNKKRNFVWILTILMFIGLLGLADMSLAAGGEWVRKADMPTPRTHHRSSVVNGKIYAIGGTTSWPVPLAIVEEYDPVTDTWTKKADMPTAKHDLSTNVVNGKIYAIGGWDVSVEPYVALSTVEEYDPTTDTWTEKADMPTARGTLSTSVVNGKIYAIGGWPLWPAPFSLSIVEEYDPVTDTWTKKADMPTERGGFSTSVVNGKIYAIGGFQPRIQECLSTVEEYDPATDTWTKKADMPTPPRLLHHSTSAVNGKIYVIGGYVIIDGVDTGCSIVEEYDPTTDTWTKKADMPTARYAHSTSAANGKIYAIGGTFFWPPPESFSTAVEEYTPEGWPFTPVSPQGKLTTTWGEIKR